MDSSTKPTNNHPKANPINTSSNQPALITKMSYLELADICEKQSLSPITKSPNTSPIINIPKAIHQYTITHSISIIPYTSLDLIELALCAWHGLDIHPPKNEKPPEQAPLLSEDRIIKTYHCLLDALYLAKNIENDKQCVLTIINNFLAELPGHLRTSLKNTPLNNTLIELAIYAWHNLETSLAILSTKKNFFHKEILFKEISNEENAPEQTPLSEHQILRTYHYLLEALNVSKNIENDKQSVLIVLKKFLAELPIDHLRTLIKNTPLDHNLGISLTYYIFTIISKYEKCETSDINSKICFLHCLTHQQILTIFQNNAFPTLIQDSHFASAVSRAIHCPPYDNIPKTVPNPLNPDRPLKNPQLLYQPSFSKAINYLQKCYYSIEDPLNIISCLSLNQKLLSIEEIKKLSCGNVSVANLSTNLLKNIDTYKKDEMLRLILELALIALFEAESEVMKITITNTITNARINNQIKKSRSKNINATKRNIKNYIELCFTLLHEAAKYPNYAFHLTLDFLIAILTKEILEPFLLEKFHFSEKQLDRLYYYYILILRHYNTGSLTF